METTPSDIRKDQQEIISGLTDLVATLAIVPIHRKYTDQPVEVPFLAASASEVHRIAGIFGKQAEVTKLRSGDNLVEFQTLLGLDEKVKLSVYTIENV